MSTLRSRMYPDPTPNPTPLPQTFTVQEVADQLGVYHQTVRAWMKQGLITPSTQVGVTYVFTQEDIDNRKPPRPARRPRKDEATFENAKSRADFDTEEEYLAWITPSDPAEAEQDRIDLEIQRKADEFYEGGE